MNFGIIRERTVVLEDHPDILAAKEAAGLSLVDHGSLTRTLGFCVDEYGLLMPAAQQTFCAIHGQLLAGNAVLYAADEEGETVSLEQLPAVLFFRDQEQVENAIEAGIVKRPVIAVNGQVTWKWPPT